MHQTAQKLERILLKEIVPLQGFSDISYSSSGSFKENKSGMEKTDELPHAETLTIFHCNVEPYKKQVL